jgi:hypothetical protein
MTSRVRDFIVPCTMGWMVEVIKGWHAFCISTTYLPKYIEVLDDFQVLLNFNYFASLLFQALLNECRLV